MPPLFIIVISVWARVIHNPCPVTEDYRQTLLTRFEGVATSYPRLSNRLCTAIQEWRSLDDLRREIFDDYVATRPSCRVARRDTTTISSATSSVSEWKHCLAQLRREMPQATYDTLLNGSTAHLKERQLTIYVRSEQAKAWLEAKRMRQLQRVVDSYLESGLTITVAIAVDCR